MQTLRVMPTAVMFALFLGFAAELHAVETEKEPRKNAELKWAKRCLYALVAVVLVSAVVSVTVWATFRS